MFQQCTLGYDPSLTPTQVIKHIIKRVFGYACLIFQKNFVFELQWILLDFAFWPRQATGCEASERNKDASHAPIVRKLILNVPHTIRVDAFLVCASPNQVLRRKHRREEERKR